MAVVRVKFDVSKDHHLSTPWHINCQKVSEQDALNQVDRSIKRDDPHGIFRYSLEVVPAI